MECTYRNKNTGDVVSYPHQDPRLEFLANWDRIDAPAAPEPEQAADVPASEPERPAVRDSKDAWIAYADSVDSDTDHSSMTKQDLVDTYGTETTSG